MKSDEHHPNQGHQHCLFHRLFSLTTTATTKIKALHNCPLWWKPLVTDRFPFKSPMICRKRFHIMTSCVVKNVEITAYVIERLNYYWCPWLWSPITKPKSEDAAHFKGTDHIFYSPDEFGSFIREAIQHCPFPPLEWQSIFQGSQRGSICLYKDIYKYQYIHHQYDTFHEYIFYWNIVKFNIAHLVLKCIESINHFGTKKSRKSIILCK